MKHEQFIEFARLAFRVMEPEQIEETVETWGAICAERGWNGEADDELTPKESAAIDRVLARASRKAKA
ncbi:MAG: hypothetical protein WAK51_15670, partial [Opitutaceae bacterium]